MKYTVKKVGHRIIHMPDRELKRTLQLRLKAFRSVCSVGTQISTIGRPMGLVDLLSRHSKDRFFVVIDFVYAFHQVTKQMVESWLGGNRGLINLSDCFVAMGSRDVIPIGFPTSNWLFEFFASRALDSQLVRWQEKHNGHITRNCDNILATWRKNNPETFNDLRDVFCDFTVRVTPKKPKKWVEPIRFCGLMIPRRGKPAVSKRKGRKILETAQQKSQRALDGALQFLGSFDKLK